MFSLRGMHVRAGKDSEECRRFACDTLVTEFVGMTEGRVGKEST